MKILAELTSRHGHTIKMYLSVKDFLDCSFLGKSLKPYFDSDIVAIEKLNEVEKDNKDIIRNIIDVDLLYSDIDGFSEVDCEPIYTDKGLIMKLELNHFYKNFRYISADEKYYFDSEITLVNMIKYN